MIKLPEYITNEQRKQIKALLFRYQSIISTEQHNVGRTNLIKRKIDTGKHRPIWQVF